MSQFKKTMTSKIDDDAETKTKDRKRGKIGHVDKVNDTSARPCSSKFEPNNNAVAALPC